MHIYNDIYIEEEDGTREPLINLWEAIRNMKNPKIYMSRSSFQISTHEEQSPIRQMKESLELIPEKMILTGYLGVKYVNLSIEVTLKP